jgi:hypothetical protein
VVVQLLLLGAVLSPWRTSYMGAPQKEQLFKSQNQRTGRGLFRIRKAFCLRGPDLHLHALASWPCLSTNFWPAGVAEKAD